jgi:hypothetical protein
MKTTTYKWNDTDYRCVRVEPKIITYICTEQRKQRHANDCR